MSSPMPPTDAELTTLYSLDEYRSIASVLTPAVFSILRILKARNKGDTYYEEYLKKYAADPAFFDQYHLAWIWGTLKQPKRILEIGTRTGISLAQLLSSFIHFHDITVVSFDLFNDGFITPALVKLNLKALNIPTDVVEAIDFHRGNSLETVPAYFLHNPDAQFDWILVDGGHEKEVARQDLESVAAHVAKDGILVFDDISDAPGECGLIDVWEQFKADHTGEFAFFEEMSGKGTAWGIKL